LRKRDLDILTSLEKFKCFTTSQLAALHFSNNANPIVTANRVLKRLRLSNYITSNTDRSFQEYIYFINPPPIKTDSQKIDHYLLINQTIIDMKSYSPISVLHVETSLSDSNIIPDIYVKGWLDNDWFIECQNSVYTTKQLYNKLDKYEDYFHKGYWNNERVLIVGKVNLKFKPEDYSFKIKQVRGIGDLSGIIEQLKQKKYQQFKENVYKSVNGEVKFSL
jgi:hypothetical protein